MWAQMGPQYLNAWMSGDGAGLAVDGVASTRMLGNGHGSMRVLDQKGTRRGDATSWGRDCVDRGKAIARARLDSSGAE